MHIHHLNTTSGKMSKSSGEFLTVSLLQEKGYDPLAYRFFCLQSHYRKNLVFSWENLDNAESAFEKLIARISSLKSGDGEVDAAVLAELKARFTDALDNDLNTSLAVTALYDALKAKTNDATKLTAVADFDRVLSLSLIEKAEELRKKNAEPEEEHDERIEALLTERAAAKKAKNYAEADRIRDMLAAEGITIIDTPQGAKWKRS